MGEIGFRVVGTKRGSETRGGVAGAGGPVVDTGITGGCVGGVCGGGFTVVADVSVDEVTATGGTVLRGITASGARVVIGGGVDVVVGVTEFSPTAVAAGAIGAAPIEDPDAGLPVVVTLGAALVVLVADEVGLTGTTKATAMIVGFAVVGVVDGHLVVVVNGVVAKDSFALPFGWLVGFLLRFTTLTTFLNFLGFPWAVDLPAAAFSGAAVEEELGLPPAAPPVVGLCLCTTSRVLWEPGNFPPRDCPARVAAVVLPATFSVELDACFEEP